MVLYIPLAMHAASTTGETKRSAEAKIAATYDPKATQEMLNKFRSHCPEELEKILASGKADIIAKNPAGSSLLSLIIWRAINLKDDRSNNVADSITIALKYGADPKETMPLNLQCPFDDPAFSLMHMAATELYESSVVARAIINALLSHNQEALVNLKDSKGRTPLMAAIEDLNEIPDRRTNIRASYTAIVSALLNHGASILMVDNPGHDSLYYARNNPEILKMLQDELAHREAQEKARKEAVYESPDMIHVPRELTDLISSYESSPK